MIVQRFNLNLIPNQSPVIVHVNQYDTGTGRLIATLYEGNEPYSPNGTAVIQGTKPDGHGFQYTATLDGNVVTADLTEQMSPVAGDVRAQIVVTESSGVTGTFVFIMRVQPSALPSDTDMSESDYQYIEEAIREAQEAVQTAQEATETAQEAVERAEAAITETQENAEDSEAWAQGTRGGIPVESTDPTYEHNAEYWAQYAERYAQGGLHYKSSIPFADIPTTGMREGDMYNITDDFTTDSRFEEGAGIEVKGGTNIAWNSDDKWDVLAIPPKTTFNGRSGSILPMAGDYDSRKILLSSALHIGGETQSDVQEALEALSNDGVKSFNGRSGSVLPIAGDYDSEKILLSSILHIGGETQNNVQEALEALSEDGVQSFNGRSGSILPIAGDYDSEKILLTSVLHIGGETQDNVQEAIEALENNKADKVNGAVANNFAGLDADGNLKDSGKKASDFATPSDIAGQQSLLKDTVGWTGKNLLKNEATTRTVNGVTFTVNVDGTITANGTATADATFRAFPYTTGSIPTYNEQFTIPVGAYILSGVPSGGGQSTYFMQAVRSDDASHYRNHVYNDYGNGANLTCDAITNRYDIFIRIMSGQTVSNLVFKPMIRKADIEDPTYEPYHESVEVMYEEEIHGINLATAYPNYVLIGDTTMGFHIESNHTGGLIYIAQIKHNTSYIASKAQVGNRFRIVLFKNEPSSATTTNAYQVIVENDTDRTSYEFTNTDYNYAVFATAGEGGGGDANTTNGMIRKADIEDSTYRPYNPQAIQNQLNAQGVLGAKNLIPYPYRDGTRTINGVTFTENDDGSITLNGTYNNTSYVSYGIFGNNTDKSNQFISGYGGKALIASLKSSSPVSDKVYLQCYKQKADGTTVECYAGDNIEYRLTTTEPQGGGGIYVVITPAANGYTFNNVTLYPMLRLASDPDDTYQPYAMTNRELTEKAVGEKHTTTITTGTTGNWASSHTISAIRRIEAYAKGCIVIPFVNAQGTWFLKVLSIDMQPVASQSIEVTYWTFAV